MAHELYHEAKRRASLPQPTIRHQTPNSLLLSAPNNIIFELFNTVVRDVTSEQLLSFISTNLTTFFQSNWANKTIQRAIERLRREQALDVRAGLWGVPLIKLSSSNSTKSSQAPKSPETRATGASGNSGNTKGGGRGGSLREASGSSQSQGSQKSPPLSYVETNRTNRDTAIKQIYEHIMWRINTDNVTQITSLLVKLALDDGYRSGKLRAELYDDVVGCFEDWRSKKLIKLYAFGNAPANDQKLILSHTSGGDLTKWVANFIDGSEKRQNPDLLRKLAGALRDRTKNCIYLTNDLEDALSSVRGDSIRCALVVDRLNLYNAAASSFLSAPLEPLIRSGRLFLVSSLDCVQFAPDPTSDNCC